MTRPLPPEPHEGIKADAGREVQHSERDQGPAVARGGSSGAQSTGPAPGDEQPLQAKDGGTASGDVLSGVGAGEQDSEDAVSGGTGPEPPGTR